MEPFDKQNDVLNNLTALVVNALSESPLGTMGHKALLSFKSSVKKYGFEAVNENEVRLWLVDMFLNGMKRSTMKLYYNRIHVLCRSWYGFNESDPFEKCRKEIDRDFEVDLKQVEDNLRLVDRLLVNSVNIGQKEGKKEYFDIFLCLLYDVRMTIDDIINLSFDEAHEKLPQIEDIADKYRHEDRTKYVFGLNQRQVRDTQISRDLIGDLSKTLADVGMRFGGNFSRNSIKEIWIAAALRCGISPSEIRALITVLPKNYSFLDIVIPTDITDERIEEIMKKVANHLNSNKKFWYAMQLRSGKTPDDVKKKLKTKEYPLRDEIVFYYPVHTVLKKRNGKLKKEKVPYLPGVLFFYLKRDDVKTLFGHYIGDEAWGYKYANHADSPYSAISRKEMERFQRHIGEFTDDIRMEMVTRDTPLSVDDIVTVYGGVMDGRICRIKEVDFRNGKRTYSLELTEKTAVQWTVEDVEEIMLEPVSDVHRQTLGNN